MREDRGPAERLDLGGVRCILLDGGRLAFVADVGGRRVELELAVRPVLVLARSWTCLVDPGFGDPDPVRRRKFALVDEEPIESQLARAGVTSPDYVLLTHLHFDHAGGALDSSGALRFPQARILVDEREWHAALENGRGGLLAERIERALGGRPPTLLAPDDAVGGLAPELVAEPAAGHTEGLRVVWVHGSDATVLLGSDLLPTRRFLRLAEDRLADQDPARALSARRAVLERARELGARLVFYHDPRTAVHPC